jgi:hypothetical protein
VEVKKKKGRDEKKIETTEKNNKNVRTRLPVQKKNYYAYLKRF